MESSNQDLEGTGQDLGAKARRPRCTHVPWRGQDLEGTTTEAAGTPRTSRKHQMPKMVTPKMIGDFWREVADAKTY